jgi:hypothetical protein
MKVTFRLVPALSIVFQKKIFTVLEFLEWVFRVLGVMGVWDF